MALEADIYVFDLIDPQFNDSRLEGPERLNESVLAMMLMGHHREEKENILTMTLEDISKLEQMCYHLGQVWEPGDYHIEYFNGRKEYYQKLQQVIEKRKEYLHKLV